MCLLAYDVKPYDYYLFEPLNYQHEIAWFYSFNFNLLTTLYNRFSNWPSICTIFTQSAFSFVRNRKWWSVNSWLLLRVVDKVLMLSVLASVCYSSWPALLNLSPSPHQQEKPLHAGEMPQHTQTQGKHIWGPAKSAEILPPCRPSPTYCTHTHSGIT